MILEDLMMMNIKIMFFCGMMPFRLIVRCIYFVVEALL